MNRRETLARLALRAYPTDARSSRDDEVVGTLLDACEGSLSNLTRELASVTRGGLTERTRRAVSQSMPRLIVDGAGWAAVAICLWFAAQRVDWTSLTTVRSYGLHPTELICVPIIAALGFRRFAGLSGTVIYAIHGLSLQYTFRALALAPGAHEVRPGHPMQWTVIMNVDFTSHAVRWVLLIGLLALMISPARPHPTLSQRASSTLLVIVTFVVLRELIDPLQFWEPVAVLTVLCLPWAPALSFGLALVLATVGARYGVGFVKPGLPELFGALCAALTLVRVGRHRRSTHPRTAGR